jgi:K+-transporting ATPase ATPase B chain
VRVLGVIELKDIVKGGIKERFAELRRMGIRTVMITGDNRLTAAGDRGGGGRRRLPRGGDAGGEARAHPGAAGRGQARRDDGRRHQRRARARSGRRRGRHEHGHAGRERGRQHDRPRLEPDEADRGRRDGQTDAHDAGALTTFSIANDIAKYFAIIPAAFVSTYPQLAVLNVMRLATPQSAILSAVIFNALIIVALIPLALTGVTYRPLGAATLLRRFLLIYGLGGSSCRSSASSSSISCSWASGPSEERAP